MARRPREKEAKGATVNVRVSQSLRERLDNAAQQAGRTMAQEVELRLAESLADHPPGQTSRSAATTYYLRVIGLSLSHLEQMAGYPWDSTWPTLSAAMATIDHVMGRVVPRYFHLDAASALAETSRSRLELNEYERAEADMLAEAARPVADYYLTNFSGRNPAARQAMQERAEAVGSAGKRTG